MKILFFGTSEFALYPLKALMDSRFDVVGVVSTPDKKGKRGKKIIETPVKKLAIEHSIEVYQPESLKIDEAYRKIKSFGADIFVVVSYGKFLPENIVEIPKYKAINIHPSILPKYRGPSPINYALLNGERYTGVSIIDVSKKMDAGDVYMQWIEKMKENENYETLHDRLSKIGAKMVVCAVEGIEEGELKARKQYELHATFTKIIEKSDGMIDFDRMSADKIVNMVKAYYGWPSAYFRYRSRIFKVLEAETADLKGSSSTVLDLSKDRLVIGCRNGAVSIKKIQPESKKPMDIKAFLAGYRFEVGEVIR